MRSFSARAAKLQLTFLALLLLLLLVPSCGGAGEEPPAPVDCRECAPSLDTEREIVEAFWGLWARNREVFKNRFLGIRTIQNPLDAWIIQEIISEVRPDFIVETGTFHGGSAILWAMILENVNPEGRVITIDIEDQRKRAAVEQPIAVRRVEFVLGSSTAPDVVARVGRRVRGHKVMVILDSLHTPEHVLAELEAYSPLVDVGSYIVVQDTLVGAAEGVKEFLSRNPSFEVDHERERYLITNSVGGYLKRVR